MSRNDFAGKTVSTLATSGAAVTLTLADGSLFDVKLTAASVAITVPTPAGNAGKRFLLVVRQDATGGRVATWPGGLVKWPGGSAPTITVAANAIDLIAFDNVDGTAWLGQARQAFA